MREATHARVCMSTGKLSSPRKVVLLEDFLAVSFVAVMDDFVSCFLQGSQFLLPNCSLLYCVLKKYYSCEFTWLQLEGATTNGGRVVSIGGDVLCTYIA